MAGKAKLDNQPGGIEVIAPLLVPLAIKCPMIEEIFIPIQHWDADEN